MKVLVADKLHADVIDKLKTLADECVYEPGLKAEDLAGACLDADALIVRSTKVNEDAIKAAKRLSLIVRAGAGVNTIDLKTASSRGVSVCNCPGKNAVAVAELAVALMLCWDRRIPTAVSALRDKQWDKGEFSKATGFQGRKIGIIGLGSIGEAVVERLQGFKVDILAWSRSLTPAKAEELGVTYCESPLKVAQQSSIVSVHLALNNETRGMFDQTFFDSLDPGDIFINTCRAEVVKKDALLAALDRGVLVGTDVFHDEPAGKSGEFDDEVAQHPNLYGSHHIGASTTQSELDTGMEAVRIVEALVSGSPLPNCVNLRKPPPDSPSIVVRHEDRVGVLAGIFKRLKEAGISVQEMENTVFDGAEAASARIVCDKCPAPEHLDAIEQCDGVFAARLSA
jgi:D-3-phosphoglycerate dehydrogenase / 2-oxoglutarate reductase